MLFGILTLLTALAIAGVAAWFSIAGLMAIFSASAIAIAIMAGVLEIGKLVTASWLYRNWKQTKWMLKSYLTIAVVVLMFITSMGIFGYLSKAHIEQTASAGDNTLQIELIENRIARQQRIITDNEEVISQLDQAVQTLIEYDRIRGPEGSLAVRQSQSEERAVLNESIDIAADQIATLQEEKAILASEQLSIEAEVGPLRYIAELIYGEEEAKSHFDEAVRWIIIILVAVFDPLAVALLIAANQTLGRHGIQLESTEDANPPKKDSDTQKKRIKKQISNSQQQKKETPNVVEETEVNEVQPEVNEVPVEQSVKEEEVRRKLGFWAVPLPSKDKNKPDKGNRYIGKK